jgi:hypothetical protein
MYNIRGDRNKASPLFEHVVETRLKLLGEEHPHTILAKENFRSFQASARPYYQQSQANQAYPGMSYASVPLVQPPAIQASPGMSYVASWQPQTQAFGGTRLLDVPSQWPPVTGQYYARTRLLEVPSIMANVYYQSPPRPPPDTRYWNSESAERAIWQSSVPPQGYGGTRLWNAPDFTGGRTTPSQSIPLQVDTHTPGPTRTTTPPTDREDPKRRRIETEKTDEKSPKDKGEDSTLIGKIWGKRYRLI